MDPYEKLANAIVLSAVRDYRSALKRLKRNPKDREALSLKKSILRFFHSRWFSCLTQVDPEYLIKRLEKEAA